MRLELALIAGILFFCTWCAYIVARMNASVSPVSAPTQFIPVQPQQHVDAAAVEMVVAPRQQTATNGSGVATIASANMPNRTLGATYQTTGNSFVQYTPEATRTWPQASSAHAPYDHQAAAAVHRWPGYSLPGTLNYVHQSSNSPDHNSPEELSSDDESDDDGESSEQLATNDGAEHNQQLAAAASGHANPAEDSEESETTTAPPSQLLSDEYETMTDDEEDLPPPQSQHDEVIQRRTFSEQQANENERDKSGRVVRKRERHLVNGRPVRPSGGARKRANDNKQSLQQHDDDVVDDTNDFDKLVSEIDEEDRIRKQAASDSNTPEESRKRNAVVKSTTARRGAKQRLPKNKNEVHEHSLQETLAAQQWDDDSSASDGKKEKEGDEEEEKEEEEEDKENVANIVERDAEARRLANLSRRVMADASNAAIAHDPLLERRKRQANDDDDKSQQSSLIEHQDNHDDQLARNESKATTTLKDVAPTHEDVPMTTDTPLDRSSGRTIPQNPVVEFDDTFESHDDDDTFGEKRSALSEQLALTKRADDAKNESQIAPNTTSQQLASQEDMHVEILADAPPLRQQQQQQQQPFNALPLIARPIGTNQILNNGTSVEFPRVTSPFEAAAGSSKWSSSSATTTKKKKKKKKAIKKKEYDERRLDAKYKAARAFANKHKNKRKKAEMRKRKRKLERKSIAGKKHFSGSMRGFKGAHGAGARGARKGATYLKDKGYKKRGFKKAYHKLETGDHKTYFDEFRDKDHDNKWKKYDDKHKYSQSKKWTGGDAKRMHHKHLDEARGKAFKSGNWAEREASKYVKKAKKVNKAKKQAHKSGKSSLMKKKKKKKKKKEKV